MVVLVGILRLRRNADDDDKRPVREGEIERKR